MLLKESFSAFALSHGDTAFVPLGLSSVGIAALVFNLDFSYFQNDLGFSFTLRARFFSKSLLGSEAQFVFASHVFFSVNTTFSINIHIPQPCFLFFRNKHQQIISFVYQLVGICMEELQSSFPTFILFGAIVSNKKSTTNLTIVNAIYL